MKQILSRVHLFLERYIFIYFLEKLARIFKLENLWNNSSDFIRFYCLKIVVQDSITKN